MSNYWELTFGEMQPYIQAYDILQEQQCKRDYTLATMIAGFISCAISGKEIPVFEKLFQKEQTQSKEDKSTMFYMDQWKAFADKRNKQLKEQK